MMPKEAEWALPPPNQFGAPEKFTSWWLGQDQAVLRIVDLAKRFMGLCLPTGAGKTLIYMVAALLEDARVCVLTTTKPLQDQLLDDFSSLGLIDIRGQGNYPCKELQPGGRYWKSSTDHWRQRCDQGPCHTGAQCDLKASGCHYFDAFRRSRVSKLVVTNYSYWMSIHRYGEGLNDFDLLVLDEAHNASAALAGFLHVDLYSSEIEGLLGTAFPSFESQQEWSQWASMEGGKASRLVEELLMAQKDHYDSTRAAEIKELKEVCSKTEAISNMQGEWVIERPVKGKKKVTFDPVWPASYAECNLFLDIPKVLLVSATIREESCRQLGVPEQDLEFLEQPSTFPVHRRLFIHIPTIRVNHRSTEEELKVWVTRIDQIIDRRLDRKGIIHTVSFARRNFLLKHTRHRSVMLTNVTENTRSVVEKFKQAEAPMVLVSPSITTGFDFPMEECRYQIIGKIPFPDHRSKVLQARCKDNKNYNSFLAMQTLVQSYGRGMRAADDFCECVDPETKVLTGDLRWVPAGDIGMGQKLVAFDEQGTQRSHQTRRNYINAQVIKASTRIMPRVCVILNDGEMVCTPAHPWIVFDTTPMAGCHVWKKASDLTPGTRIPRFLEPWSDLNNYRSGWLAGFFDGEGCLVTRCGTRNPTVMRIEVAQNEGKCYDQALVFLSECGFDYYIDKRKKCRRIVLRGGQPEILRFLGSIRPSRLLEKFVKSTRAELFRKVSTSRVIAVETLPDGPITSLQTSAKTFIAQGFGAHNCLIVDDNIKWFMYKHGRAFSPKWFREAYKSVAVVPSPPDEKKL